MIEHIAKVCKHEKGNLMQCGRAVAPFGFSDVKSATMHLIYEVMVRLVLGDEATIWLNGIRTQPEDA